LTLEDALLTIQVESVPESKPVFYDPQRKRWKRLRRIFDILGIVSTCVLAIFCFTVFKREALPELLLSQPKPHLKPLIDRIPAESDRRVKPATASARRKTTRPPSEIPLNTGESLRAAYYVDDDAASFSSFREHVHQIDILFPEWLHVINADGTINFYTEDNRVVPVVSRNAVENVDRQNKIWRTIVEAKEENAIELFPMVNNYNILNQSFDASVVSMFQSPAARAHFTQQLGRFFAANPHYHGLTLDLENIGDAAEPAYLNFVTEVAEFLHARHLKLYVNVGVSESDQTYRTIGNAADGVILMNYDQHESDSDPGPVAAQDWFVSNLQRALKIIPRQKLICAIGNYGYDWTVPGPGYTGDKKTRVINTDVLDHVQAAWQAAADSDAQVVLDPKSLNAHFAYDDEDAHTRHQVWFLDAVTALNEIRAARTLGLQTFALWRLGSEDRSMWNIWDHPAEANVAEALRVVPPGHDVDTEGDGDILRITDTPRPGERSITLDQETQLINAETMLSYPRSYTVQQYGYVPNTVAFTFDDGPDAVWTPPILKILKEKNVKGTFMVIGEQAQDNVALLRQYISEGHEIGNHTFTHPDISEISQNHLKLELNLTERLFESKLGIKPLYFRPPYSIDQEPDTDDQARPVEIIQNMGYIIVGDKIDTSDWDENPRKTPQEITQSVFDQLDTMKVKPWFRGSIILMHDGGGDRSSTVAALPVLIDALRAKGYKIVPVSALLGKTTAEVMPPVTGRERWAAQVDSLAFSGLAFFDRFVVIVFFVGDVLMSARLLIIGLFAVIDRFRHRKRGEAPGYQPAIAVLIPAYNEGKVIARTIRSVLNSDYPKLHVIVIDDGSADDTYEVARTAFPAEIASGRLTVLTKPNAGKAEALNFALQQVEEEVYVGIDADTIIAPDAVGRLVKHFSDPEIGAVAGNAKVGNRINLWTRWQALEYITSQNFERRALDLFNVVTVVPGAIGAWRTAAVKAGGCYHANTVAEDADLTMNLLEQGLKVIYEDRAIAFTEAPANMRGLMRQRFRWSFGTLQAVFKHKRAFTRRQAMGLFALPNILVFQMLLPLVSPFIDLMFVAGALHYLLDLHFHPEAASSQSFDKLCVFFLAFLVIDFVTSCLAFLLERRHPANKGDGWLLFHIWLQRFAYRQVFSIVLFKTLKRAIDGKSFAWEKLERTARMSRRAEAATGNR
jgi:peptidoglycan-N-acetylglucosamine deacetylase